MEYNSGELICKRCGNNGMNIYTNWLNRKKYINNSLETQWIFYNKSIVNKKKLTCKYYSKECFMKPFYICDDNKCLPFGFWKKEIITNFFYSIIFGISIIFVFLVDVIIFLPVIFANGKPFNLSRKYIDLWKKCLKCDKTIVQGILLSLLSIILLPFMLLYIILFGLLYILVFMWIDICSYLCCKKNEYRFVYSYIQNHNIYQGSISTNDKKNIWNYCEGITERELTEPTVANFLFTCSQCTYHFSSFKDFIPNLSKNTKINNSNDYNETILDLNAAPGLNINNNNISIIFSSCDQGIQRSVACKLTDKFKNTEKKLIQDNPNLKNKQLLFLFKGQEITDKNKTLAQLKMKNSDIVLFQEAVY